MTQLEKTNVLRSLNDKMQAHSEGVLALFRGAGIESDKPTLKDLAILQDMNPTAFVDVLRFLFPEKYRAANATGFDWTSLVGGVLTGAGSGLLSMNSNNTEMLLQQQQTELAAQEAAANKRTLYLVLGIVAVLIVAAVIIFKGKKR